MPGRTCSSSAISTHRVRRGIDRGELGAGVGVDAKSTATQSDAVGQEIPLISIAWLSSAASCQAPAPPVGFPDAVSAGTPVAPATHSGAAIQASAPNPSPCSSRCVAVQDGAQAPKSDVLSTLPALSAAAQKLAEVQDTPRIALLWSIGASFHAPVPAVGCVVLNARPIASPPTHSVLLGQVRTTSSKPLIVGLWIFVTCHGPAWHP